MTSWRVAVISALATLLAAAVALRVTSLVGTSSLRPPPDASTKFGALDSVPCWFDDSSLGFYQAPDARCAWLRPSIQNAARDTALPIVILQQVPGQQSQTVSIYLPGGPGGSSYLDEEGIADWRKWRARVGLGHDLVLFDPRGTGYAKPDLYCEAYEGQIRRELSQPMLSVVDAERRWREFELVLHGCLERVPPEDRAAGIYSTSTFAVDVLDLVRELRGQGYREVVLYGVSYGSRLATQVALAADEETRIDRLVLDSWYPTGVNLTLRTPQSWDEALRDFAWHCEHDPDCDDSDSDLRSRVHDLLARPAQSLGVRDVDLGPGWEERRKVEVPLSTADLPAWLMEAMATDIAVDTLPRRIDEAVQGEWSSSWQEMLNSMIWAGFDWRFSPSVYALAECADTGEFTVAQGRHALAAYPELAPGLLDLNSGIGYCTRIGVPARPLVPSRVMPPTIVVATLLDPVTPWRAARDAMPQLNSARFHLLPGAGHGVADADDCAALAIGQFMNSADESGFSKCGELDPALLPLAPSSVGASTSAP